MAEAFGCFALRVEKHEEVRPALEKAMAVNDKPVLLEFRIDQAENCWPMVAPGKASSKMLGTYDELVKDGAVAQRRRLTATKEADLSLS
jgi:acetolactate synthase-1/2/3 large subunit